MSRTEMHLYFTQSSALVFPPAKRYGSTSSPPRPDPHPDDKPGIGRAEKFYSFYFILRRRKIREGETGKISEIVQPAARRRLISASNSPASAMI